MKKVNIYDHLVNLVVVIVGVTIAFWLGARAQDNRELKSELAILQEIRENLIADTLMMRQTISKINQITHYNDRLLNHFQSIPADSLPLYLFTAGERVKFYKSATGYQRLLQRGDLMGLSNQKLVSKIMNFYNDSYKRLDEWLEEEKQYTERVEEFYLNNVPANMITGYEEITPEKYKAVAVTLESFTFKNIVIANQLAKKQLLSSILTARGEFKSLIDELEQY